jgi:hypothetical protein
MKLAFAILAVALVAIAQTAAPEKHNQLPAYIMAGLSYNQYTGGSGFVSGIVPESNRAGVYGSATADIVPVKVFDPVTKRYGYALSASARGGQHKVVYNDGRNMLLLGGDLGASFSQSDLSAGLSIGIAGSFTATYIRQLGPHFGIGMPLRMLWMSGVGPGGRGVWNPVGEIGIVWKP